MICKDPAINYLKSFGYNIVRLPRADYSPLQIFVRKKGVLESLGHLNSVLRPTNGISLPTIKKDTPAIGINGRKTSNLSAGIGLNILGNIIGAMGGGKLGLETKFQSAKNISFNFTDVLEDSVEIAELDRYLASSDIDSLNRHIATLLESDDIYVMTSVIKSNTIITEIISSAGTAVDVDIPQIKEIVGGQVNVGANNDKKSELKFTGPVALVFGFKAVRIFYKDGIYQRFDPKNDGKVTVDIDEKIAKGSMLFSSESTLVSLAE